MLETMEVVNEVDNVDALVMVLKMDLVNIVQLVKNVYQDYTVYKHGRDQGVLCVHHLHGDKVGNINDVVLFCGIGGTSDQNMVDQVENGNT